MPRMLPFLTTLLCVACLTEPVDGDAIRAAAFSDSEAQVTLLAHGGVRWTDVDVWVAWAGPATLKSSDGYAPCGDPKKVADAFTKRDPERRALLGDLSALSCLSKSSSPSSGRWLLSHSSGVHWWRAWNRD